MSEDPRNILVVGATSSLAQALCRALAKQGHALILAGRDELELRLLASDLHARFASNPRLLVADLLAPDFSPGYFIEQAGEFDEAIIAVGDMGNGNADDLLNIAHTTRINYTIPAQIAARAAEHLLLSSPPLRGRVRVGGETNSDRASVTPPPTPSRVRRGNIVIISSVAGDRGRQSNYVYGSAKAALSTFASGLRNRYARHGVHVITVKPGFIDTPMTWDMKSPLIASREYVAAKIIKAMAKKKNVVYVPFFWRWIMLIIMHIPEKIFKRLKL